MKEINKFFDYMIKNKASDLHISAGTKPKIRKHGELEDIAGCPELNNDYVKKILFDILTDEQQQTFLTKRELDFGYELPNISRFRVNYFFSKKGLRGCF